MVTVVILFCFLSSSGGSAAECNDESCRVDQAPLQMQFDQADASMNMLQRKALQVSNNLDKTEEEGYDAKGKRHRAEGSDVEEIQMVEQGHQQGKGSEEDTGGVLMQQDCANISGSWSWTGNGQTGSEELSQIGCHGNSKEWHFTIKGNVATIIAATSITGTVATSDDATTITWSDGVTYTKHVHVSEEPCERPATWCTHFGSIFREIDCDGDGILDPYCKDHQYSGFIASANTCKDTWPHGGCYATCTHYDCPIGYARNKDAKCTGPDESSCDQGTCCKACATLTEDTCESDAGACSWKGGACTKACRDSLPTNYGGWDGCVWSCGQWASHGKCGDLWSVQWKCFPPSEGVTKPTKAYMVEHPSGKVQDYCAVSCSTCQKECDASTLCPVGFGCAGGVCKACESQGCEKCDDDTHKCVSCEYGYTLKDDATCEAPKYRLVKNFAYCGGRSNTDRLAITVQDPTVTSCAAAVKAESRCSSTFYHWSGKCRCAMKDRPCQVKVDEDDDEPAHIYMLEDSCSTLSDCPSGGGNPTYNSCAGGMCQVTCSTSADCSSRYLHFRPLCAGGVCKACADDPHWDDSEHGGGGAKCHSGAGGGMVRNPHWCKAEGEWATYSAEARRACPLACGVCQEPFTMLKMFKNGGHHDAHHAYCDNFHQVNLVSKLGAHNKVSMASCAAAVAADDRCVATFTHWSEGCACISRNQPHTPCFDSPSYLDPKYRASCSRWTGYNCDWSTELKNACPRACGVCVPNTWDCLFKEDWSLDWASVGKAKTCKEGSALVNDFCQASES